LKGSAEGVLQAEEVAEEAAQQAESIKELYRGYELEGASSPL
jgi:hypothetical protein